MRDCVNVKLVVMSFSCFSSGFDLVVPHKFQLWTISVLGQKLVCLPLTKDSISTMAAIPGRDGNLSAHTCERLPTFGQRMPNRLWCLTKLAKNRMLPARNINKPIPNSGPVQDRASWRST